MKLFAKIFIGIIIFMVLLIAGLNLYLTDERLKNLVLPQLNEMTNREIQVDNIGFTLFRTFPTFNLVINEVVVPDIDREAEDGTFPVLASLDRFTISVQLFPLLSGNLKVNAIELDDFAFNYFVFEDGNTNLDSLLSPAEDETEAAASDSEIDIQKITIRNAALSYINQSVATEFTLSGLDAEVIVRLTNVLETDLDATVRSLQFISEGSTMVDNLAFNLSQTSVLDMENEHFEILSGVLGFRGLDLDLKGSIRDFTQPDMFVDLEINSATDDFASLLQLLPDEFKEDLEGVQTGGGVVVNATLNGVFSEETIPDFNALISVTDAFVQYPGVDEPIQDIQIQINASNEIVNIERINAIAAGNNFTLGGVINNPLEDNADFNLNLDFNLDLATVERFYPLDGVLLSGKMTAKANLVGVVTDAENANFNADLNLVDGFIKLPDLEEPVRNMNVALNATQNRIQISSFAAEAAENKLALSGTITDPLDDDRTSFNLTIDMFMDLATLPKFYPIDTDTLDARGVMEFQGTARGRVADPENLNANGKFTLRDGSLRYHELPKPIDRVEIDADINGNRITINTSGAKVGSNEFSLRGNVTDFITDNPSVDITVSGDFLLDEFNEFIDFEPYINTISGRANSNLRVSGPVMDFESLRFRGGLTVTDFSASDDSLPAPITELNGSLQFNNNDVDLERFSMKMGESDFDFAGTLRNYMRLVEENPSGLAELNATFRSDVLNIDELYQYEPLPEDFEPEPFPIELPNLRMNLDAEIGRLVFFEVPVTNIKGRVTGTNNYIAVDNTSAELFGGKAEGRFRWDVPQPDRTKITFVGTMTDVEFSNILSDLNPAGLRDAHEYMSGRFTGSINYVTEMDEYLDPIVETTVATGDFGVRRARVQNHPTQLQASELLNSPSLSDLSLDNWVSKFSISDGIMTLKDMDLTSTGLGIRINGTQNLIDDRINYSIRAVLPGTFAQPLEPVITREGVRALQGEDGRITVPLQVRGTTSSPRPGLDQDAIQERITQYLREQGEDQVRNLLRNIFGN